MTAIVNEWLAKSDHDLRGARLLAATGDSAHADLILFLCQQSVEKAMKAALTFRGEVPPKSHDLVGLGARLGHLDPRWQWDEDDLDQIGSGAVDYRYPGPSATLDEARDMLAVAERVRAALLALLGSPPAQPSDTPSGSS